MSDPLRIVFAGTPEFAARHLQTLLDGLGATGRIIAVYTQPDRPAGRGKKLMPTPVKRLATEHALPVLQPLSLRDPDAQAALAALEPDLMVVVAYGLILPQKVLDIPRLGCINVHASLLPRWRGAAPIQRAIEAGDTETGVTLMQMDAGLDTGPMLATARCAITADDTSASLHDKLAALGGPALLQTVRDLAAGQARPEPQDDALSCYAPKLGKNEAAVDWNLSADQLDRRIRAFVPAPVAYGAFQGERVKIHQAHPLAIAGTTAAPGTIVAASAAGIDVACGADDVLRLSILQLPGGRPLSAADVLNGHAARFATGARFDTVAADES